MILASTWQRGIPKCQFFKGLLCDGVNIKFFFASLISTLCFGRHLVQRDREKKFKPDGMLELSKMDDQR